jgi:hypothetical protein
LRILRSRHSHIHVHRVVSKHSNFYQQRTLDIDIFVLFSACR